MSISTIQMCPVPYVTEPLKKANATLMNIMTTSVCIIPRILAAVALIFTMLASLPFIALGTCCGSSRNMPSIPPFSPQLEAAKKQLIPIINELLKSCPKKPHRPYIASFGFFWGPTVHRDYDLASNKIEFTAVISSENPKIQQIHAYSSPTPITVNSIDKIADLVLFPKVSSLTNQLSVIRATISDSLYPQLLIHSYTLEENGGLTADSGNRPDRQMTERDMNRVYEENAAGELIRAIAKKVRHADEPPNVSQTASSI